MDECIRTCDNKTFFNAFREEVKDPKNKIYTKMTRCDMKDIYSFDYMTYIKTSIEVNNIKAFTILIRLCVYRELSEITYLLVERDRMQMLKHLMLMKVTCIPEGDLVFNACRNGNIKLLRFLIRNKVPLDGFEDSFRCLDYCIEEKNFTMVKMLLYNGVRVDQNNIRTAKYDKWSEMVDFLHNYWKTEKY